MGGAARLVTGTLQAACELHATKVAPGESNTYKRYTVGGETAMKERFSSTELTALRNDLLQGGLVDSREAAELLQVFLMGRGYGVSPQAAMDAVGRVEMSGCSLPVLEKELENLALVM
jgi:hypothetical protein